MGRESLKIGSVFTRKVLPEIVYFLAYFLGVVAFCVLATLLVEPLVELETWLTTLIREQSVSLADFAVQREHGAMTVADFSTKVRNGLLGAFVFFLFFCIRRLMKGVWIHQEGKSN